MGGRIGQCQYHKIKNLFILLLAAGFDFSICIPKYFILFNSVTYTKM